VRPSHDGDRLRRTTMRHTGDERGNDLATVLRSAAVPYGYTVTVWGAGMMLTREGGLPSVEEIFLFVLGAVAGFAVLGLIVRLTGGMPSTPSYGALLRTGMIQFVAVGIALGSASLIALIHGGMAWPLAVFVATATYLSLATLELTLAKGNHADSGSL
jgi:hypothetical protein